MANLRTAPSYESTLQAISGWLSCSEVVLGDSAIELGLKFTGQSTVEIVSVGAGG